MLYFILVMLQPIDRKLTLVIVKSNAEVATTQEREEQLRAQIAALSCEVSLTAIDTVVKLLVRYYGPFSICFNNATYVVLA